MKDDDLQEAFDKLWPTWSSEMAAMIYADIIQVMDLILLTSIVDNRREIERIKPNYYTGLRELRPLLTGQIRVRMQNKYQV